jgi:site-specific DNA recombinase
VRNRNGRLQIELTSPNTSGSSSAALYARISIDREESISIESQVAALHELCMQRGWSVADDAIFVDRGFSGKNTRRPGFQAMLSRVKRGEFGAVVVYKLDRISRSVSDLFATVDEFERNGCSFVASSQPFDTSTPVGKLLLTMLAGVAAFEREMIVERTRDSLLNNTAVRLNRWSRPKKLVFARHCGRVCMPSI